MILSHVVAMAKNGVIGKNNTIPWNLPEDRKYFRNLTLNHPIIMGRKTFESLKTPLPKRTNIVISRTLKTIEGCQVFSSLKDAINYCKQRFPNEKEVFIIGGSEIYKESMPLISKIYLTEIHQNFDGNAFYPEMPKEFDRIKREDRFDSNPTKGTTALHYSFMIYENQLFTVNF